MKALPKTRARAKTLRRAMTKAETTLWSRLRRGQLNGFHFRRQHPVGAFIADFACAKAKLIIEVDGATHSEDHEIAYDAKRQKQIEDLGWTVLRIWNLDVYENLEGVLENIHLHLTQSSPLRPSGTSPRKRVEDSDCGTLLHHECGGGVSGADGWGTLRKRGNSQ